MSLKKRDLFIFVYFEPYIHNSHSLSYCTLHRCQLCFEAGKVRNWLHNRSIVIITYRMDECLAAVPEEPVQSGSSTPAVQQKGNSNHNLLTLGVTRDVKTWKSHPEQCVPNPQHKPNILYMMYYCMSYSL